MGMQEDEAAEEVEEEDWDRLHSFWIVGVEDDRRQRSKSVSMMCPSHRTRMFSGLRSRYTIPSM